ncbi:aminoglycoside phosphotransferase family protein [Streptomyces albiaxialis]|uniref:Aminoglycoside phosphotransferase family protein n=1 Tax=Streptomyces albiaxialis TaxID=329523 RepID=A0ABP5I812_9ACTN
MTSVTPYELFPQTLPVMTEMRRTESGREWLAGLPALVERMREQWELRLGAPYHGGSSSWVAPVERADGSPAVLKVTWPHREAVPEGPTLRLWDGRGAVRVHAHDPEHYALLLERCEPGTELGRSTHIPADERLLLGCEVMRELWRADLAEGRTLGLETVGELTAEWADLAEEQASRTWPPELDAGLFRLGAGLFRELPRGTRREVVVHGDFNPGNLMAAERAPWLAIDPHPLTGDPAFEPWPLIEQVDDPFAKPDPHAVLAHRTALVADALGEDRDRVRAWSVARHIEYALWSVDEDDTLDNSVTLLRQARILADVAGL